MSSSVNLIFGGAVVIAGCLAALAAWTHEEEEISLSEVPVQVLAAVREARNGITLKEAERIRQSSGLLYEIEGDFEGVELEFLVTPAGEILEIEEDD